MISRSYLHMLMLALFFSKGQGQLWPTFLMWRHAWKHWVNLWWTSLHWMTYQKQTVVWCLYSAPKKFQRLFSRICAKVLKIKSKPFLWNDHKSENLKIYRIKCCYLLLIITLITIILISLNFCFVLNCNFGCYPRLRGRNGAHHVST